MLAILFFMIIIVITFGILYIVMKDNTDANYSIWANKLKSETEYVIKKFNENENEIKKLDEKLKNMRWYKWQLCLILIIKAF